MPKPILFFAHDFKTTIPRYRDTVSELAAAAGFRLLYGEARMLEDILSPEELHAHPNFLQRLKLALERCDVFFLDLSGYSEKEDDAIDGFNQNVLFELGLAYGRPAPIVNIFCREELRLEVRRRLSNLQGESPNFNYYTNADEFTTQFQKAVGLAADVIRQRDPVKAISLNPSKILLNRRCGFTVEYPLEFAIVTKADGECVEFSHKEILGSTLSVIGIWNDPPGIGKDSKKISGQNVYGWLNEGVEGSEKWAQALFPSFNPKIVIVVSLRASLGAFDSLRPIFDDLWKSVKIGGFHRGGVDEIDGQKLPPDPRIRGLLNRVGQLEHIVSQWADAYPMWRFEPSKEEVVHRIKEGLQIADELIAKDPSNSEAHLLRGLLAHYAHNLSLYEFKESILGSFDRAIEIRGDDIRPRWFKARHILLSKDISGIDALESLAHFKSKENLPVAFLDSMGQACYTCLMWSKALDYLQAALAKSGVLSNQGALIYNRLQEMLRTPEVTDEYAADEVFTQSVHDKEQHYIARMGGFAFTVPTTWEVRPGGAKDGKLGVLITPPPYKSPKGDVHISISIIAGKMPSIPPMPRGKDTQTRPITLELSDGMRQRATLITDPSRYVLQGGGCFIVSDFVRGAPAVAGSLLERPSWPDFKSNGEGAQWFRPREDAFFSRMDGEIRYSVILDSCVSIFEPAFADFQKFLRTLVIE